MALIAPTQHERTTANDSIPNDEPPGKPVWPQELMKRVVASVILDTTSFDSIQLKSLSSLTEISSEYLRAICNLLKLETEKNGRTTPNFLDLNILSESRTVNFNSLLSWIKEVKEKTGASLVNQDVPEYASELENPLGTGISKSFDDDSEFSNLFGKSFDEAFSSSDESEAETSESSDNSDELLSPLQTQDESNSDVEMESGSETRIKDYRNSNDGSSDFICNRFSRILIEDTSTESVEKYLKDSLKINIFESTTPTKFVVKQENINQEKIEQGEGSIKLESELNLSMLDKGQNVEFDQGSTFSQDQGVKQPLSEIQSQSQSQAQAQVLDQDLNLDQDSLVYQQSADYVLSMFQSSVTNFEDMGIPLSDLDFSQVQVPATQISRISSNHIFNRRNISSEIELGAESHAESSVHNKIDSYIASIAASQNDSFDEALLQDQDSYNMEKPADLTSENALGAISNSMDLDWDTPVPPGTSSVYPEKKLTCQMGGLILSDGRRMDADIRSDISGLASSQSQNQSQNRDSVLDQVDSATVGKTTKNYDFQVLREPWLDHSKLETGDTTMTSNSQDPAVPQNQMKEPSGRTIKLDPNFYALELLQKVSKGSHTQVRKSYFSEMLTETMKEKLLTVEAEDLGLPQPSLYVLDESVDSASIFSKCLSQWIESTFDRENLVKIMDYKMQVMEAKSGKDLDISAETITPAGDIDLKQKRSPYAGGIVQDGVYQLHDRISLCAHGFRDGAAQTVTGSVTKSASGIISNR